jgi:glycosyltransferase involved in cell wall biosynthesis
MLLMHAMHRSRTDFELVVKSQEPTQLLRRDRRIIWDHCAPEEQQTLYEGFDALIMPRRYGGLCLPMNEALTSGLPVIMSDTSQQRRSPP